MSLNLVVSRSRNSYYLPNIPSEYLTKCGLNTFREILKWNHEGTETNGCWVCPLKTRSERNGPKVIFCHDYIYNFSEYTVLETPLGDEMQFYMFPYWSLIDIFIYFSHKLVTVPPISWICACHENGVRCLGTFMVEHWSKYSINSRKKVYKGGKNFLKIILKNPEILATCLANIQKFYNFDGWLLNIESPIDDVSLVENFIFSLKRKQPRNSTLIWYDSLNKNGELKWQNELNEMNKNFFNITNGIFLNYQWKVENLEKSVSTCLKECRRPLSDVFVGIDCYGRGCIGDGGYGTYLAVKKALEYNLSVAIFAPGWTHESKLDNSNKLAIPFNTSLDQRLYYKKDNYTLDDEYKFWSKIAIDGNLIEHENELSSLPLYSCFDIGHGINCYDIGVCRLKHNSTIRWASMRPREILPSFFEPHQMNNEDYRLSISFTCPFNGGSSFQIEMFNSQVKKPITLFRTRIVNRLLNFRYQLVYRFQKTNLIDNRWLEQNVRVKTIIDYIEVKRNIKRKHSFILNSGAESRKNLEVKRLVLNHTGWNIENNSSMDSIDLAHSNSYQHNKIIPLNKWNCQQIYFNLEKSEHFKNTNSSIIFLAFSILPYFISNNEQNLDKISKDNSLYFYIGEFYFDYFKTK